MTDAIPVSRGECLDEQGAWTDQDGTPIDLTGETITIFGAKPAALNGGTVTVLAGTGGLFTIHVDADLMALAPLGRLSYFRLALSQAATPDCPKTTPPIWINVQ